MFIWLSMLLLCTYFIIYNCRHLGLFQVGLRERQGPTRDIWVYSKWVRKARILWGRSKCARALLRMKSIWNWSCLNLLIYIYFLDNENEKIPCHEWKFTVRSGHAYMVIDNILFFSQFSHNKRIYYIVLMFRVSFSKI